MILPIIGIFISYLHISALATTDIMRLLAGSNISVFDSKCYCSECGHKIALIHQVPILAYILNGGKCPYCKTKIDPMNFYLEVVLYGMYVLLMLVFAFKPIGVLVSFAVYEAIKIGFLIVKGRKKEHFFREYILTLFTNAFIFSMVGFMSVLYNYIANGQILN